MKPIRIAEDIVPIARFKGAAARWLQQVSDSKRPVVITLNGKPAGVLVSPSEYDRMQDRDRFLQSVAAGIEDADAGRVMNSRELRRQIFSRRKPEIPR